MYNPRKIFQQVLKCLPSAGTYVVGGAVRDRLLGRDTVDFDLMLQNNPGPASEKLAKTLGGRAFPLDAERGIVRVTSKDKSYFDLAQRQGNSLETDLDRRDFTLNAMAVPLSKWLSPGWRHFLIDRHGGENDLKNQRIKAVSKVIFAEDPLRLLRTFRMAAEFDFSIAPDTLALASRNKKKIRRSAPERVREELLRIFATPRAHSSLVRMEKTGLLDVLFPESASLRRTAPSYYGRGGVLKHTLDSVKFFEEIQAGLKSWFPKTHAKIRSYLGETSAGYARSAHCKWALLLHDVGKPDTAKMIKGRLRFFEHEHVGAEKVFSMSPRYRWSTEETHRYARLVRHHMRPGNLAAQPVLSDKAIHRFFRDLGEDAVSMLLVSLADHLTYLTPAQRKRRNSAHELITLKMIRRYYTQREKILPAKIINGNDVMKTLGLPPSPLIGALLKDVEEAQCEGKIKSKKMALAYLKGRIKLHESGDAIT